MIKFVIEIFGNVLFLMCVKVDARSNSVTVQRPSGALPHSQRQRRQNLEYLSASSREIRTGAPFSSSGPRHTSSPVRPSSAPLSTGSPLSGQPSSAASISPPSPSNAAPALSDSSPSAVISSVSVKKLSSKSTSWSTKPDWVASSPPMVPCRSASPSPTLFPCSSAGKTFRPNDFPFCFRLHLSAHFPFSGAVRCRCPTAWRTSYCNLRLRTTSSPSRQKLHCSSFLLRPFAYPHLRNNRTEKHLTC